MWLRLAEDIGRHGTKKEVASDATVVFFLREVRGISMQVHHHVGNDVVDFGIGMSC